MQQRIMKALEELDELPGKINSARLVLITVNANHEISKAQAEAYKANHVMLCGGWSGLGKNESEREMNLTVSLNKEQGWALRTAALESDALDLADAREDYDSLCRQFDAVKAKVSLLTAYLNHYPYTGEEMPDDSNLESILFGGL